ncbi:hypothetical protein M438DRAFT_342284 [Aureobasidium pullulans EXF-150]|uniref:Uncharacterized protein n=1 Tax=Aureobasidium pullulans EXF-150 TaxID=1043002 RepID=A0A074XYM0_AURPU|nr:uncharacterized protein M438DRAFT_342284 [Aureobasidium pullulans EXF-150]KEQ88729.1 hypothetical protein M438DRAFT_342284 [Aureobasidium pullulans EXF-150]
MIRRGSAGLGKVKGIDRNCPVGSWKCSDQAGPSSPCAKLCHAHSVEMHNVFRISAALH